MPRNQRPAPSKWLITDARLGDVLAVVRRLPRGTGVLVRQHELPRSRRQELLRRLRRLAQHRDLVIVNEADGRTARIHDPRELRQAILRRSEIIFVSPMHETRTHPGWSPLPRMRAAALVRLSSAPLLALGGMDAWRYRSVSPLGFAGWGGIDGWVKGRRRPSWK